VGTSKWWAHANSQWSSRGLCAFPRHHSLPGKFCQSAAVLAPSRDLVGHAYGSWQTMHALPRLVSPHQTTPSLLLAGDCNPAMIGYGLAADDDGGDRWNWEGNDGVLVFGYGRRRAWWTQLTSAKPTIFYHSNSTVRFRAISGQNVFRGVPCRVDACCKMAPQRHRASLSRSKPPPVPCTGEISVTPILYTIATKEAIMMWARLVEESSSTPVSALCFGRPTSQGGGRGVMRGWSRPHL